jgi:hypothetical protein
MKKIVLVVAMALIAINLSAQKFWNFSDGIWNVQDYTTPTVIDGLSINPSASGVIAIDANKKSIDGYSFTQRLKLGGAGTPAAEGRNVSFPVTGPCKVTVYGMASTGTATDRSLIIHDGTTELYSEILLGDVIYKKEYDYTGNEATLYLYSSSSGLNFYGIKVESGGTSLPSIEATQVVQSVEYFDLLGKKVNNSHITNAILIKKTIYTDGSSSNSKVMSVY